ncbi:Uncharacterised protein [uncultured archaeon]|nr:Uncharacterised protein [uncultured archaeon]
MEKSVKITGIIAVTIIVLALIGYFGINGLINMNAKTVDAQGYSSIKVTPDLVNVYFTIETKGKTAVEAKNNNSVIVDDMITALMKLGIAREDIKTQGVQIYEDQVWENGQYVSKGYKASHQINILLNTSEAGLISDVIDAGVNAGAMLNYINFELSTQKQNEYKAQALKEAGADARIKAQAIAEGLGMKVGSLVSVSTSNFYYQPWNIYSARGGVEMMATDVADAKVATTNIVPGTQEVTANINVVYKLR